MNGSLLEASLMRAIDSVCDGPGVCTPPCWLTLPLLVSISQQSAGCETVTLPLHCTRLSMSSSETYQRRPFLLPSGPSALLPPVSHVEGGRLSTMPTARIDTLWFM